MKKSFWHNLPKPILALAPMAGITDSAFREICKKYGADVVYSEMASVSALFFKPARTLELLKFNSPPHQNEPGLKQKVNKLSEVKSKNISIQHNIWCGGEKERPYVVQLFGKNPEHFAKAAQIVSKTIRPDGIDINFGCPAKKVFGHGSGCALMLDIDLSREIIKAVCDNTDLPVSLKIRSGLKDTNALKFIKNIKDLDFKAVMIHCRTYEQGFSGLPDYSIAEKIKKIIPNKIVLVNGGINTPNDALEILKKYKTIDGLGIARGALGRPWIFDEIKDLLKNTSYEVSFPRRRESSLLNIVGSLDSRLHGNDISFIKKIAIAHAKLLHKNKGQRGLFEIRKHMTWYFKGFPNASDLRKKLVLAKNLEEIKKILK